MEVEERLRTVAVVDQAIEGREERDAVGDGIVGDIGMRLPALPRQADAERAEALLREGALRVGFETREYS